MSFISQNMIFMSTEVKMYEPINIPELRSVTDAVSNIRFALVHSQKVSSPDDKSYDPLHLHPYWELYLHLFDEASFLANGHLYSVKKGDGILTAPGNPHMLVLNAPTETEHYCLWLDVPENTPITDALRSLSLPFIHFDPNQLNKLCLIFSETEKATEANDSLYLSSLLLQTICTLRDTANSSELYNTPPLLQQILTDINESCAEIRNVKHLCERHYTSPSTLNRLFQKHIHVSPHTLLESHKLALAARLLLNGASVMDACMRSGFSDCSHFIVLFKRKFGVTPHQYKS